MYTLKMHDYDKWNGVKKKLAFIDRGIYFKECDVWWISLGLNIGEEVYGKSSNFTRPVIILKKLNSTSCIILPLSTKTKQGSWFHSLKLKGRAQTVSIYQMRFVSSKRFIKKLGEIPESDFELIRKAVAKFYGFS